jgi:hypothetical protein
MYIYIYIYRYGQLVETPVGAPTPAPGPQDAQSPRPQGPRPPQGTQPPRSPLSFAFALTRATLRRSADIYTYMYIYAYIYIYIYITEKHIETSGDVRPDLRKHLQFISEFLKFQRRNNSFLGPILGGPFLGPFGPKKSGATCFWGPILRPFWA